MADSTRQSYDTFESFSRPKQCADVQCVRSLYGIGSKKLKPLYHDKDQLPHLPLVVYPFSPYQPEDVVLLQKLYHDRVKPIKKIFGCQNCALPYRYLRFKRMEDLGQNLTLPTAENVTTVEVTSRFNPESKLIQKSIITDSNITPIRYSIVKGVDQRLTIIPDSHIPTIAYYLYNDIMNNFIDAFFVNKNEVEGIAKLSVDNTDDISVSKERKDTPCFFFNYGHHMKCTVLVGLPIVFESLMRFQQTTWDGRIYEYNPSRSLMSEQGIVSLPHGLYVGGPRPTVLNALMTIATAFIQDKNVPRTQPMNVMMFSDKTLEGFKSNDGYEMTVEYVFAYVYFTDSFNDVSIKVGYNHAYPPVVIPRITLLDKEHDIHTTSVKIAGLNTGIGYLTKASPTMSDPNDAECVKICTSHAIITSQIKAPDFSHDKKMKVFYDALLQSLMADRFRSTDPRSSEKYGDTSIHPFTFEQFCYSIRNPVMMLNALSLGGYRDEYSAVFRPFKENAKVVEFLWGRKMQILPVTKEAREATIMQMYYNGMALNVIASMIPNVQITHAIGSCNLSSAETCTELSPEIVTQQDKVPYVMLEYVDGPTLREFVEKPFFRAEKEDVKSVISQVYATCELMKRIGISHGNVTPDTVRIIDLKLPVINSYNIEDPTIKINYDQFVVDETSALSLKPRSEIEIENKLPFDRRLVNLSITMRERVQGLVDEKGVGVGSIHSVSDKTDKNEIKDTDKTAATAAAKATAAKTVADEAENVRKSIHAAQLALEAALKTATDEKTNAENEKTNTDTAKGNTDTEKTNTDTEKGKADNAGNGTDAVNAAVNAATTAVNAATTAAKTATAAAKVTAAAKTVTDTVTAAVTAAVTATDEFANVAGADAKAVAAAKAAAQAVAQAVAKEFTKVGAANADALVTITTDAFAAAQAAAQVAAQVAAKAKAVNATDANAITDAKVPATEAATAAAKAATAATEAAKAATAAVAVITAIDANVVITNAIAQLAILSGNATTIAITTATASATAATAAATAADTASKNIYQHVQSILSKDKFNKSRINVREFVKGSFTSLGKQSYDFFASELLDGMDVVKYGKQNDVKEIRDHIYDILITNFDNILKKNYKHDLSGQYLLSILSNLSCLLNKPRIVDKEIEATSQEEDTDLLFGVDEKTDGFVPLVYDPAAPPAPPAPPVPKSKPEVTKLIDILTIIVARELTDIYQIPTSLANEVIAGLMSDFDKSAYDNLFNLKASQFKLGNYLKKYGKDYRICEIYQIAKLIRSAFIGDVAPADIEVPLTLFDSNFIYLSFALFRQAMTTAFALNNVLPASKNVALNDVQQKNKKIALGKVKQEFGTITLADSSINRVKNEVDRLIYEMRQGINTIITIVSTEAAKVATAATTSLITPSFKEGKIDILLLSPMAKIMKGQLDIENNRIAILCNHFMKIYQHFLVKDAENPLGGLSITALTRDASQRSISITSKYLANRAAIRSAVDQIMRGMPNDKSHSINLRTLKLAIIMNTDSRIKVSKKLRRFGYCPPEFIINKLEEKESEEDLDDDFGNFLVQCAKTAAFDRFLTMKEVMEMVGHDNNNPFFKFSIGSVERNIYFGDNVPMDNVRITKNGNTTLVSFVDSAVDDPEVNEIKVNQNLPLRTALGIGHIIREPIDNRHRFKNGFVSIIYNNASTTYDVSSTHYKEDEITFEIPDEAQHVYKIGIRHIMPQLLDYTTFSIANTRTAYELSRIAKKAHTYTAPSDDYVSFIADDKRQSEKKVF